MAWHFTNTNYYTYEGSTGTNTLKVFLNIGAALVIVLIIPFLGLTSVFQDLLPLLPAFSHTFHVSKIVVARIVSLSVTFLGSRIV
jgi:hypothetical protein